MAQNLPGGLFRCTVQYGLKKTWGSEKVGNSLFSGPGRELTSELVGPNDYNLGSSVLI